MQFGGIGLDHVHPVAAATGATAAGDQIANDKGLPAAFRPPKATINICPADGAGTLPGKTSASAARIGAGDALDGGGARIHRRRLARVDQLPFGRCMVIGRKHPALVGIFGSVIARTAKQAAASEPEGTQFNGPRTCGLVPVKSSGMNRRRW